MPGYVLAKLELNDEVYHLVKNTPKVTGFLGPNGKPQPIPDAQASRMLDTSAKPPPSRPSRRSASTMRSATASRCSTGRSRASTGWSRNWISTARVKVSVSIFGRATPVELEFEQVERVK